MIKEKLQRAIRRSEKAYKAYQEQQFYFQALRIYRANRKLYGLLEDYLLVCGPPEPIKKKCLCYAVIEPGGSTISDVAKKNSSRIR